jgi:CelD/BcsL family acetyltransferase involved in cellulose biosynthesis
MARTTVIETLEGDGPSELLAGWERLADDVRASPFLYPGFVLAWWRAFGDSALQIAVTRDDDRVAAVLPLVSRRGVLASPANWHTPETGVLAQDELAVADLVTALLARRPRRLSLAFLDRSATTTATLHGAVERAGYRITERPLANAPFLELHGDWEAFEGAIPAKERKPLKRRARRLAELGSVSFDVSTGDAQLDERFDELVRVEALGWKGEQGTAMSSQRETLDFYRDVARWGSARGWLRMQALRLDDAAIAVAFGLEAHGVLHSLKTGFDPAHRALGPGVMLMRELVRQGFEDGLARIELLGDADPYKRLWSSGVRERIAFQAFSRSPGGRLDHVAFAHGLPLAKRLGAGRLRALLSDSDRPRI